MAAELRCQSDHGGLAIERIRCGEFQAGDACLFLYCYAINIATTGSSIEYFEEVATRPANPNITTVSGGQDIGTCPGVLVITGRADESLQEKRVCFTGIYIATKGNDGWAVIERHLYQVTTDTAVLAVASKEQISTRHLR